MAMLTKCIDEFSGAVRGAVLSVDFGDKRVGLARADSRYPIASPYDVITYKAYKHLIAELLKIIDREDIKGIVCGYPLHMDGTEGVRCQKTLDFVSRLQTGFTGPILLWDERLSTVQAQDHLLHMDVSRKRRRDVIDKMAAVYILQSALEKMKINAGVPSA